MLQVGVKVFLKNREGKFLILKRSAERYPNIKKLWDIVGGRIEPGTPLLENLKREVREETKLEIQGQPKFVYAQDILRPDKHIVRLTFVGQAEGTPVISEEEEAYAWQTLAELKGRSDLDEFANEVLALGLVE